MKTNVTRRLLSAALIAVACGAILPGCAGEVAKPNANVAQILAPSGKLRVGLYPGSPTSIVGSPEADSAKGVGFDLGRELAKRLGVPFEPVVYPKNADVLAAIKNADVDLTLTNATAERAKDMQFSSTVLEVEKGYLVPANSRIHSLMEVDRQNVKVGVTQGSSTVYELKEKRVSAAIVQISTLKIASEMLASGQIDAFATNKAILYEMSDALPGSKLLDGHWGIERFAFAIPKGREQASAYLDQLLAAMKSQGQIGQSVKRVGLRGTLTEAAN
jgi:polar amino acid transport system substrate-binding protein